MKLGTKPTPVFHDVDDSIDAIVREIRQACPFLDAQTHVLGSKNFVLCPMKASHEAKLVSSAGHINGEHSQSSRPKDRNLIGKRSPSARCYFPLSAIVYSTHCTNVQMIASGR